MTRFQDHLKIKPTDKIRRAQREEPREFWRAAKLVPGSVSPEYSLGFLGETGISRGQTP